MLDPFDARIAGDARITTHLFGGNVLAPRGDHSDAIAALGVTGLRYPGGSLTEHMFDITNPNATELVDQRTGELRPCCYRLTNFLPMLRPRHSLSQSLFLREPS